MNLKKHLIIESLHIHIEKYINDFINSDPIDEQEGKIILLLRDYKEKSTSGLPEAREIIKSHIKNCILTGFDIYLESQNGELDDASIFEEIRIDETNGLIDNIMPFNNPQNLTPREKFEIILFKNSTTGSSGRDGAFKSLLSRYPCCSKSREAEGYESMRHEYGEEDIEYIYKNEDYKLSFTDKIEIITQRLYGEIFGLKHIDMLAYSDINEVGFSNNGKYIYCWCGKKIWLSFMKINESEARVIQDRAMMNMVPGIWCQVQNMMNMVPGAEHKNILFKLQ